MSDVSLSSFPASLEEAIAFLYVQNQDLTGKTPAEIYTIYQCAYYEVKRDRKEKRESGWFNSLKESLRE